MRHLWASRLLSVLAFVLITLPLLAQQDSRLYRISVGSQGKATAQLKLLTSPPEWWSIRLNESGEFLEKGETVQVLEIRAFNTLFGRNTWIRVQTVPDDTRSGTWRSGWIYGGTSGETLVSIDPP